MGNKEGLPTHSVIYPPYNKIKKKKLIVNFEPQTTKMNKKLMVFCLINISMY